MGLRGTLLGHAEEQEEEAGLHRQLGQREGRGAEREAGVGLRPDKERESLSIFFQILFLFLIQNKFKYEPNQV